MAKQFYEKAGGIDSLANIGPARQWWFLWLKEINRRVQCIIDIGDVINGFGILAFIGKHLCDRTTEWMRIYNSEPITSNTNSNVIHDYGKAVVLAFVHYLAQITEKATPYIKKNSLFRKWWLLALQGLIRERKDKETSREIYKIFGAVHQLSLVGQIDQNGNVAANGKENWVDEKKKYQFMPLKNDLVQTLN